MSPDDIENLLQGHSDSLAEWARSVTADHNVDHNSRMVESIQSTPRKRRTTTHRSQSE